MKNGTVSKTITGIVNDIMQTGGTTVNMLTDTKITTGYIASLYGYEVQISDFSKLSFKAVLEQVNKYLKSHPILYVRGKGLNFGAWVNSETDTLYFDISVQFAARDTALQFAQQNRQTHIFDTQTFDSIAVSCNMSFNEGLAILNSGGFVGRDNDLISFVQTWQFDFFATGGENSRLLDAMIKRGEVTLTGKLLELHNNLYESSGKGI